ncbi:protein mel-28 [Drosophila innubila]|uniref:protein mel-28 n=1 Tax=Drosophila innubila TaxID=198719 RepID=UPI00148CCF3E|nr:protein mel-28 [Drosophila innubila]
MLSKMAQSSNVGGGGGGGGPAAGGRRVPLSLSSNSGSSGSSAVSRLQQAAGSNGRSNSPQNSSNTNKKNEQMMGNGPFVSIKKTSSSQKQSTAASSSTAKDEEKKGQNGVNKSSNSNPKSSQSNGSSNTVAKEQPKPKEKPTEKKEPTKSEAKQEEAQPIVKEPEIETKVATVDSKQNKAPVSEVIDVEKEPDVVIVPTTPTSERKSSRRVSGANQQKTPNKAEQIESSPVQKKAEQPEEQQPPVAAVEDVEMETLAVEASPIRSVASAQPAATSTPGRNLFGFRSSSKQTNEVDLATQPSSSPASVPARSFAPISGRRSIRPTTSLTPGKLGNYRCLNTSELDTSGCTNTSMNATVGSEIPNCSSFSFSFFGRGRKRERTPPPLSGSQSTSDLGHDVEMSPPKRARFELFSLNLASPFSMLRSRFSKATISTPSSRQRLDQTPPAGEDEVGEKGEVQNVSGIVIQEEEEQQLNKSSASNEQVTVGQEAGLETPKKSGSPMEGAGEEKEVDAKKADQGDDVVANLPSADVEVSTEIEGPNRSRCAIM